MKLSDLETRLAAEIEAIQWAEKLKEAESEADRNKGRVQARAHRQSLRRLCDVYSKTYDAETADTSKSLPPVEVPDGYPGHAAR